MYETVKEVFFIIAGITGMCLIYKAEESDKAIDLILSAIYLIIYAVIFFIDLVKEW